MLLVVCVWVCLWTPTDTPAETFHDKSVIANRVSPCDQGDGDVMIIRHTCISLTLLLAVCVCVCVCVCVWLPPVLCSPADRPDFCNLAVTLSELASEATGVSVENWLAGIMPSVPSFSAPTSAETVATSA